MKESNEKVFYVASKGLLTHLPGVFYFRGGGVLGWCGSANHPQSASIVGDCARKK